MPNCPTFIIYYFATLKAGGTVVNYNPLYTLEELTFQVKDSETELMVTLDLKLLFDKVEALMQAGTLKRAIVASFPALLPGAKSVLFKLFKGKELAHPGKSAGGRAASSSDADVLQERRQVPAGRRSTPSTTSPCCSTPAAPPARPRAPCSPTPTSPSTCQQVSRLGDRTSRPGKERVLAALPFFHVFAMTAVMNFAHRQGGRDRHHAALRARRRHEADRQDQADGDAGRADHVHRHAQPPQAQELRPLLAQVLPVGRRAAAGRGQAAVREAHRLQAGGGLRPVGGLPSVTCNPLEGPVKEGSIGQPLPGTIVSLRDLADPTKEVPLGEKGEICIKGPQVMKGYWKRPEETANQFVGDYLRTGDVGIMDEEGFIFIVDRIKDLIICSGYNVYPRRIEEAIYEHPAVEEVTVIGIKDDYRGEAPKAFIKLKAGAPATEDDIRKHLEAKISKIEMPAEIEFRDALPKTMIGKLSKKELKAEEDAAPESQGQMSARPARSGPSACSAAPRQTRSRPPLHHRRAGRGVRRHHAHHPLLRGQGADRAGAPRRGALLFAARPGAPDADPARQEPGLQPGGDRPVPEALRRRSRRR